MEQHQQQVDMGYSLELASQALAATGAKSTLKATEWILNKRRAADQSKSVNNNNAAAGKSSAVNQSKLDCYFGSKNKTPNALQLRCVPEDDLSSPRNSIDGSSSGSRAGENSGNAHSGPQQLPTAPSGAGGGGGGGGARAGIVGVFDSVTGAPLGWRSVKSARQDPQQEDVGKLGHGGGGGGRASEKPRFGQVRATPATRDDEAAAAAAGSGSFSKVKRALLGQGANDHGGGGGGSLSTPKRHKQHGTEAGSAPAPAPAPAPLAAMFSNRQSFGQSGKQQKANVLAPAKKTSLAPLAERMRPATIDDVVGQDSLRQMLRNLLDNGTVQSMILFGPPGTGKTTIARAIARSVPGYQFVSLSAVHSGTKEVRTALEDASKHAKRHGQRTLLFMDEVHRFNKAQQDLFLPAVEAGTIIFVGATTENPSFEINASLLSRCRVLTIHKLEPEHLREVLERAIMDKDNGVLASLPEYVAAGENCAIEVEVDALNFLAGAADGDARVALNAIEVATAAAYSKARLQITRTSQNQDVPGTVYTNRPGGPLERIGSTGNISSLGKKDPIALFGSDRAGNGFGSKRLEALLENVKECANSNEDYSKPFKRFVGGKEVTPMHNPARFEREVVSLSAGEREAAKDPMSLRGVESTEALERKLSNPDAIVPDGADMDGSVPLAVTVTLLQVKEAFQRSHVLYDKTGEEHYNIISALHKSMRGGDADAAIYWLARMLEGGEGPLYVARRLVRFASEDVGLADPHAMGVAVACYQACHFLGMPECNVNLAQCVVYLAYAPKSVVVYQAIEAAQKLVRETPQNEPVPLHLRNAPTRLMKEMGCGKGYIYPPGHSGLVEQEYMPPSLQGQKFLQWPEMND